MVIVFSQGINPRSCTPEDLDSLAKNSHALFNYFRVIKQGESYAKASLAPVDPILMNRMSSFVIDVQEVLRANGFVTEDFDTHRATFIPHHNDLIVEKIIQDNKALLVVTLLFSEHIVILPRPFNERRRYDIMSSFGDLEVPAKGTVIKYSKSNLLYDKDAIEEEGISDMD